MESNRKQAIEQYLCTLKDRLLEIDAIKRDVKADLDLLPGTDDYDDLRDDYTDALDNLDSVTTDLYYLIKRIDLEINGPGEAEAEPKPSDPYNGIPLPQEVHEEKSGFFSKLMLGLFGAHVIHKDAARRNAPDDDIDDNDEDLENL